MKKIFKTKWFNIQKIKHKNLDFYKFNHPNAVLVLPITTEKEIILIKQFRPSLNKKTLEFPSGNIEKNEKPLQAAKRELFEETGYKSKKWFFLNKGVLRLERESSKNYYFIALDCCFEKKTKEKINTIIYKKKKLKDIVRKNKIDHIAAYPLLIWAEKKYKLGLI